MADTTVREALQRAIEETGITPAEVAVGIGKHPDTIARWLAGRSNPPERGVHDALIWMGQDPAKYGLRRRPTNVAPGVDRAPDWFLSHSETLHAYLVALEQRAIAAEAKLDRIIRAVETSA
jgi:transcriptional regulator with XRE-family HTH domain